MQPAELIIIGGAAAGTLLIANPVRLLKEIAARATSATFADGSMPRWRMSLLWKWRSMMPSLLPSSMIRLADPRPNLSVIVST